METEDTRQMRDAKSRDIKNLLLAARLESAWSHPVRLESDTKWAKNWPHHICSSFSPVFRLHQRISAYHFSAYTAYYV